MTTGETVPARAIRAGGANDASMKKDAGMGGGTR
jgi:hypothetical protein